MEFVFKQKKNTFASFEQPLKKRLTRATTTLQLHSGDIVETAMEALPSIVIYLFIQVVIDFGLKMC